MCFCTLPPGTGQQGPHTHPDLPRGRAQHRVRPQLLPPLEKIPIHRSITQLLACKVGLSCPPRPSHHSEKRVETPCYWGVQIQPRLFTLLHHRDQQNTIPARSSGAQ